MTHSEYMVNIFKHGVAFGDEAPTNSELSDTDLVVDINEDESDDTESGDNVDFDNEDEEPGSE